MIWLYLIGVYILGSIPTAYILTNLRTGEDIRRHGSGNVGATNVSRVLGLKFGLLTTLLDALKSFVPLILLKHYVNLPDPFEQSLYLSAAGILSVTGHIFPIFLGFKGGKGVATTIGVILALVPLEAGIFLGLYLLLIYFTGYVSLSSLISSACLPLFVLIFEGLDRDTSPYTGLCTILALVIWISHRDNIKRLRKGEEKRISFAKKVEKTYD